MPFCARAKSTFLCLTLLLALLPAFSGQHAAAQVPGGIRLDVGAPESARPLWPLVEKILRDAGVAPNIAFFPAARSEHMFITGHVGMEVFRVRSVVKSRYPEDTLLIGPLLTSRVFLYGRTSSAIPAALSTSELLGMRLAYNRGSYLSQMMVESRQLTAYPANSRENLYQMLLADRVDFVIDDERLSLMHLASDQLNEKISKIGNALSEDQIFILLRPEYRALAPRLQSAFDRWLEDGRWAKGLASVNQAAGLPATLGLLPRKK